MTGREKIEAAFSEEPTKQTPAVICYERLFARDHWDQLSRYPWWYWYSPDIEQQLAWRLDAIEKIGQDWLRLVPFHSRDKLKDLVIETSGDKAFLVNKASGERQKLSQLCKGGESFVHKNSTLPETIEDVDKAIPVDNITDTHDMIQNGHDELAKAMIAKCGGDKFTFCHVLSPFWACYTNWGFEGLMMLTATSPDLVKHACQRHLQLAINEVRQAALIGTQGIWIEECLTDMINMEAYMELSFPYTQNLIEEIRSQAMKSIHYFAGDPAGKLEQILQAGPDAISLEESKKDFHIDIDDIVRQVKGRCVVLGNLDAIGILQDGTEEQLRAEISRQISAGGKNDNRFIMSLGSPPTPQTPVDKIRLYCDLVRQLSEKV